MALSFSFFGSLFPSQGDREAKRLLRHLEEHPDSYGAYTFLALVTAMADASAEEVKRELAKTLHALIHRELAKPDRNPCWFHGFFDHTLEQYESSRKSVPDEYLSAFLIIAGQENSGFIREKAVREWKTRQTPLAVRFLIDRLADWVPQVRAAAWDSLRQYMTPEYHACFLERFYWIDRLLGKGNSDSVQFGQTLVDFVFSHEFSQEVEKHLKQHDSRNWKCYVKHAVGGHLKTNRLLLDAVRKDSSPTIRSSVIRILDDLSEALREAILADVIRDPAQPVRSRALYYIVQHLDRPNCEQKTLCAAADYSPAVREVARFYLRDKVTDWRAFYLERIDSDGLTERLRNDRRQTLGCLGGFSEYAVEADISVLERLAKIQDDKAEAIALEAIYRLDPIRGTELATELLPNHAGRLGRCCLRILSQKSSPETLAFARTIANAESSRLRIIGLRLLEKLGGWRVAADLILATADTDEAVRKKAVSLLNQWIRKFSTQCWINPGTEETERVVNAVKSIRSRNTVLPSDTIKTILFFFGVREK